MDAEQFRNLWVEASEKVADRFYPKGHPARGYYLRDQGILHVEVATLLAEAGLLEKGQE